MIRTDEFLKQKIGWKAARHGFPTATALYYTDLPADTRLSLEGHIDRASSGLPVLFFRTTTGAWTLVCTRQVISFDHEATTVCNLSAIATLRPAVLDKASKAPLLVYKEGNHDKRTWNELVATDKQGNKYILRTSPGADLFALWNILLMTTRLMHKGAA